MDYEQLAEAHQRVADAHAHLAGLLQGRCVQPVFLIPEIPSPAPALAPEPRPAKIDAHYGKDCLSSTAWRQILIWLRKELQREFGTEPFRSRDLRLFLETRVELYAGDLHQTPGQRIPRWQQRLHDALCVNPEVWGPGGPVIVRTVGADQWIIVS